MRRVVGLAMVVAALGWAGCGDSDHVITTGPIPTVAGYFAAEATEDFPRACDYLTPGRQAELVKAAQSLRPKSQAAQVTSCPDALSFIFRTPGLHHVVANPQGFSANINPASARVVAESTTSDGRKSTTQYHVVTTKDGWKIAVDSGATNATARVAPP
ncbi:MAG: hypothetical protein ACRDMH_01125 [Solirubrobacterales bacterium]